MDAIYMDFSLQTPEERIEKVKEIIANTPSEKLTPLYLDKLAKYILKPETKVERKSEKQVLTANREKRIMDRETSFEGLAGRLENGEDGIYNMIREDKNIIFQPKTSITQEDLDTIPHLKELHDQILKVEAQAKTATGKRRRLLTQQIIEMRKDQYVIRAAYKKPVHCMNLIRSISKLDLSENITVDNEEIHSDCLVNIFNEKHVSALLCNYSRLKEDSWDRLNSDAKWLIEDLERVADSALKEKYPLLYQLMIYKIDGMTNAEIQEALYADFGIKHTVEYISSLWRNKIPKLIAETAIKEYLVWYYTYQERGKWKKCGRCGQIKLAHNLFFSKNGTSKDGFYSICKDCRNKKRK